MIVPHTVLLFLDAADTALLSLMGHVSLMPLLLRPLCVLTLDRGYNMSKFLNRIVELQNIFFKYFDPSTLPIAWIRNFSMVASAHGFAFLPLLWAVNAVWFVDRSVAVRRLLLPHHAGVA